MRYSDVGLRISEEGTQKARTGQTNAKRSGLGTLKECANKAQGRGTPRPWEPWTQTADFELRALAPKCAGILLRVEDFPGCAEYGNPGLCWRTLSECSDRRRSASSMNWWSVCNYRDMLSQNRQLRARPSHQVFSFSTIFPIFATSKPQQRCQYTIDGRQGWMIHRSPTSLGSREILPGDSLCVRAKSNSPCWCWDCAS